MSLQHITIIGAAGNLGRHVLSALIASPFTVTILARHDSTSIFPPQVTVKRANPTNIEDLKSALQHQDAVVCCHAGNSAAILSQLSIIDAAEAVGVKRIILNEFANSPEQEGVPELEWARKDKRRVREHAKERAAANAGFSWTGIATWNFIDFALKKFPKAMGFDIAEKKATLMDSGNGTFTGTTMADIARAVVGTLRHPDETANRFVHVRSIETTQMRLLKAFETVTREKWGVGFVDSQAVYERGKGKLARGEPGVVLDLVPYQLFAEKRGDMGSSVLVSNEQSDGGLLGIEEIDEVTLLREVLGSKEEQGSETGKLPDI